MAEEQKKARVPTALKRLVLNYQNTCVFMAKMWRRLMMVLAVAFPMAFYLREETLLQAMVNAVGFWLIFGVVSRLAVLEFRIIRAGWAAEKIDRRIPLDHPSRQAVIEWITKRNDGNFLNSLLKKLGVAPNAPRVLEAPQRELNSTPYDPTAFINGVLEKLGKQGQHAGQTYVYSSQTQVLNDNGEWVTIESSTSDDANAEPPETIVQQALEETTPPEGFKPIPIPAPASSPPDSKKKKKRRRRRRRDYMLLEPEAFQPEKSDAGPAASDGESDRR